MPHELFLAQDPDFDSRDPELQSRDPEIKKITRVALMGHRTIGCAPWISLFRQFASKTESLAVIGWTLR